MSVEGIDVSRWQGDVDWVEVKKAGYEFAFCKATEGVGWKDPKFDQNWAGIASAGIIRGAYHFARVSRSPTLEEDARAEASWFAEVVGEFPHGSLPPVLDVEWDERAKGIQPKAYVDWCLAFLDEIELQTGRLPIVYVGNNFWRYKLGKTDALVGYPLWQVRYTKDAKPRAIGNWPWTFWQHTAKGRVPGIRGNVDLNRFSGTMTDLRRLADVSPASTVPTGQPAAYELSRGLLGRWACAWFEWWRGKDADRVG